MSYTFLFWLPSHIRDAGGFDASSLANLSTVFEVGGVADGILTGHLSDTISSNVAVCSVMLALAVPLLLTTRVLSELTTLKKRVRS
ncbi:hypothetical protein FGIG_07923 [Fasciola gigantica]|uniref:Uncharacterized protein n=1 Tax=Fasciola gigantica TaxID=46835 RepID=A0A504Y8P3_FASGI|nr:hypothetical protein FGIG_07923 [Fasciola gigantica]